MSSVTIFNTACARCHEGECSGRMSFHLPKAAADQHMRRHGGELSLDHTEGLFTLLRYMKEECRFYPFSLALVNDRVWTSETLTRFRTPSGKAYFIPVGRLQSGFYQLLFDGLHGGPRVRIEILSDEFEFVHNDDLRGQGGRARLSFRVDEPSEYCLRIVAQEPMGLGRLELLSNENRGPANEADRTR